MEQKFIDLYDTFTHGGMNRRNFMERLTAMAGSTAAAATLLATLQNDYAEAAQVADNDPRLRMQDVILAPGAKGYLVLPKAPGTYPAVMVTHENRGLNPHIRDVARRVALEGFLAFAPDYLAGHGGTPTDEDKARDMIGQLTQDEILAVSKASLWAIEGHAESTRKAGAVGFCWGGGAVNALAVAEPTLKAGVAYYGMQPPAAQVPRIEAALLLHYAGLDTRIDAGIPDFVNALKAARKTYEIYVYDGANHAFNNDTNAARYDKTAADLAWGRTVAFLKKYLA